MKLEVGMYVRYTRGMINGYVPLRIGRIVDCLTDDLIKINNSQVILRSDIVKASHNIIDLIEEGDYVNGRPVFINEYGYLEQTCINADGDVYYETLRVENIKDIATKEQFDSMKYEVDSNE